MPNLEELGYCAEDEKDRLGVADLQPIISALKGGVALRDLQKHSVKC